MEKGNIYQTRKNVRSRRIKHQEEQTETYRQDPGNAEKGGNYAAIEYTGKVYTYQMGQLPVTSSKFNKYIMEMYVYNENSIMTEPHKNRMGPEIKFAYKIMFDYLTVRGYKPTTHWLENEELDLLKYFDQENEFKFQLAPPGVHRRNAAERKIRMLKTRFIAGQCSADRSSTMHLWDILLEQSTLPLNVLRQARRNPQVSAHTVMEGLFYYNHTPLAPPGTKVVMHEKADKRGTWEKHGVDGWYLGPSIEHY